MVVPILVTAVTMPADHPRAGLRCQVFAFLIRHESGPVLVDTGVGIGNEAVDRRFSATHHPLADSLADQGVAPGDVVMVINSHLHFDHCGNNRLFPGIPLVVQRVEREAAETAGYTVDEWLHFPGARWHEFDGAAEVLPGVRLLPTPGHTAGHQSVVVAAGNDLEIIAAQAVYDAAELEGERSVEPLSADDHRATTSSARAINSLSPRAVYFSHSATVTP